MQGILSKTCEGLPNVVTDQGRRCTGCVPCFPMHHKQCEEIGLGHRVTAAKIPAQYIAAYTGLA